MIARHHRLQHRRKRDLRESEERFRATFEQAAIGLAHGTIGGRILRVNKTFAAMLGYQPQELEGMHFAEITHPHDVRYETPAIRDLLTGRETIEMEKRYLHRDGRDIWMAMTLSLARSPVSGEPYVIGSMQDISERKLAEMAIIESEQRFRLVAAATNDAILDSEPQAGRIWWNRRFETLFGAPPRGEIELFDWWKARVHPDDRKRIYAEAARVLFDGGGASESEYRWMREDGRVFFIHEQRMILHDSEGRQARMVISIADRTAARELEESIRRSEAKFRRVYESDLVGILFWNANGAIEDANDAALEILGVPREDLASANWRQATPPEHAEADARALAEIAERGVCRPFRKEYVRRCDGTRVAVMVAAASYGEQGQGVAVVRRVTEGMHSGQAEAGPDYAADRKFVTVETK